MGNPEDTGNNRSVLSTSVLDTPDLVPAQDINKENEDLESQIAEKIFKTGKDNNKPLEDIMENVVRTKYDARGAGLEDDLAGVTQKVTDRIRADYRSQLKAMPYNHKDRAKLEQDYRNFMARARGEVSANEFASAVLGQASGSDAITSLIRGIRGLWNDATGDTQEADDITYEGRKHAKHVDNLGINVNVPLPNIPYWVSIDPNGDYKLDWSHDIGLTNMPIPTSPATAVELMGLGSVNIAKAGVKVATKSVNVVSKSGATKVEKIGNEVIKFSTAGNLSLRGVTRNAILGAAWSRSEGDLEAAKVGGVLGVILPGTIEGTVRAATKPFRISSDAYVMDQVLNKSIKNIGAKDVHKVETSLQGVHKSRLQAWYKEYALAHRIEVEDMTVQDKFTVLRRKHDTINDMALQSEGNSIKAQTDSADKAADQVRAVVKELYADDAVSGLLTGSTPLELKDILGAQVANLSDGLRTSIKTLKDDIEESSKQWIAGSHQIQLDIPEPTGHYIDEILDIAIDNDLDPSVFNKLVDYKEANPMLETAGDVHALVNEIPDDLLDIISSDGRSLGNKLHELIEHGLEPHAMKQYYKYLDDKALLKVLQSVSGLKKLFSKNATPTQKASAMTKFLKTDSYKALLKLLADKPEQTRELERVALASIFGKKGNFSETGRVAWSKLYNDIREVEVHSEDMKAVKELIRVYAKTVGDSKAKAVKGFASQGFGNARPGIMSEAQAQAVGGMLGLIWQFIPTEKGRNSYIVNHAARLIKGERVATTDSIKNTRLAGELMKSLVESNPQVFIHSEWYTDLQEYEKSHPGNMVTIPVKGEGGNTVNMPTTIHNKTHDETFKLIETSFTMRKNVVIDGQPLVNIVDAPALAKDYRDVLVNTTVHTDHSLPDGEASLEIHDTGNIIRVSTNVKPKDLIHEIVHAIDIHDKRATYGSSPATHIDAYKEIVQDAPSDAVLTSLNIDDLKLTIMPLIQKGVDMDMIASLVPGFKYLKNEGEVRAAVTAAGKAGDKDAFSVYNSKVDNFIAEVITKAMDDVHAGVDVKGKIQESHSREYARLNTETMQAISVKNPGADHTAYDRIRKHVDDMADKFSGAITHAKATKYLNGKGITNDALRDMGLGKLLSNPSSTILPSDIKSMLPAQGTRTAITDKSTLRNKFTKDGDIVLDNGTGKPVVPAALQSTGTSTIIEVQGPKSHHLGQDTHTQGDKYKSHVVLIDAKLQDGTPTTYIAELQNDLNKPVDYTAIRDELLVYNDAVDDLSSVQSARPDESSPSYADWEEEVTSLEQIVQDAIDSVNYTADNVPHRIEMLLADKDTIPMSMLSTLSNPEKLVPDSKAFVRDGLSVAIDEAISKGNNLITWGASKFATNRYASYNTKVGNKANELYVNIYDKLMPKEARKYAEAHNLDDPKLVGDMWLLDITSTRSTKAGNDSKSLAGNNSKREKFYRDLADGKLPKGTKWDNNTNAWWRDM